MEGVVDRCQWLGGLPAKCPQEVVDDGKVGAAMIRPVHLLGKVETLLFACQEMAHGDAGLIAEDLAFGQADGRRAVVVLRKGCHVEGYGGVVGHFEDGGLMVYYIIVTMVDATPVLTFVQFVVQDIVEGLPFRHIEIANPLTAPTVEVDGGIGIGAFHRTVDAAEGSALRGILGPEPAEGAER